ncbi:hypothetical protein GCM10029992_55140 [Glycomyces albus]
MECAPRQVRWRIYFRRSGRRGPPRAFAGEAGGFRRGRRGGGGGGQLGQEFLGPVPADAGVGDALAVFEGLERSGLLAALGEEALDHQARDALLARGDPVGELADDGGLADVVLAAVGVAGVDDQSLGHVEFVEQGERVANGFGPVVGAAASAAQDDVAVGVAAGRHDRAAAVFVDAEEDVLARGRAAAVDGGHHVAVGGVLEAHRHRQSRDELAVDLALGRAGADGAPGDGVGDVLGAGRLEELAGDRQARVQHLEQDLAGQAQAQFHVVGAVEVRVVDQALPAEGRAGLLEVDAHDHAQVVAERGGGRGQSPRVVRGRCGVVDRAGADDEQQPVVLAGQDVIDGSAAVPHEGGAVRAQRQFAAEHGRWHQGLEAADAQVAGVRGVVGGRCH